MALADLNVSLGLITRDFDKALGKTERKLNRFARNLNNIGSELTTSITLPLVGIGGAALKTAADFEQLRTSFGVLLDNVREGNKLFSELQDFAASTPFQLQDIASAAKQLLAFGFSAGETKDALSFLGDIAAGTGQNLGELSLIVGQARAIGAAYTEDLRQLAGRGIPVFDLLKEQFNLTGEELKKFVQGGGVTFEVLQQVLKNTTKAGGLFAGGLQAQSKTLAGVFSTLKDNVSLALADLGDSISKAFRLDEAVPELTKRIQEGVKAFRSLDDGTKRNIVRFAAFAAAIGPVTFALGKVISFGSSIVSTLRLLNGAFASVAGGVLRLAAAFKALSLAQQLTVIGLVATAVGLLAFQFSKYRKSVRDSEAAQRSLSALQAQSVSQISEEVGQIEILKSKLEEENLSREGKGKIIKEIQALNPEYFSGLDTEKSKISDLTGALDKYAESLRLSAELKVITSRIGELSATLENASLSAQAASDDIGFLEKAGVVLSGVLRGPAGAAEQAADVYGDAFARTQKLLSEELNLLQDRAKEIQKQISITPAGVDDSPLKVTPIVSGDGDSVARKFILPIGDAIRKVIRENPLPRLFADTEAAAQSFFDASSKLQEVDIKPNGLQELNNQLQLAKESVEAVGGTPFEVLNNQVGILRQKLQQAVEQFGFLSPQVEVLRAKLAEMEEEVARFAKLQAITQAWADTIANVLTPGFSDFFTTLIEGGKNAFGGFISAIKKLIVQLAAAVATAAALALIFTIISGGSGAGLLKIKGLLGFSEGSLFKNFLNFPGFADGGIVPPGFPNDSYPALLTSGETVVPPGIPLPKTGGGELTGKIYLSGNDLMVAVERFAANRSRTRGI